MKIYQKLISNEEWQTILSKKLKTTKFTLIKVRMEPFSEDQMGFMGDHLKVEATVQLPGADETKTLWFFAKSVPMTNETFRNYVDGVKSFYKEFIFYSYMLSDLKKFVAPEIGDNSSVKKWICECYLSKPEIFVLEDLVDLGFQQTGREPMDYDHCVLTLQTMAQFHAATIIFEENQGIKIFDKYRDGLFETMWVKTKGHPGYDFLQSVTKGTLSLLDCIPKYSKNSTNFETIRKKLPEAIMRFCEYVKPSAKFRNVICHGDLWASNVFFQYNNNNKPIEARLIDFQLMRYNPPANDVICFLHLVVPRQFREVHLEEFLTIYYQSLTAELKRNNLDVGQLLPWSEFKESCDFYRNSGRTTALVYFQQCLVTGDYLKNIFADPNQFEMFIRYDKSKYLIECYKNDSVFREGNTEAIEEFIEHCILNM